MRATASATFSGSLLQPAGIAEFDPAERTPAGADVAHDEKGRFPGRSFPQVGAESALADRVLDDGREQRLHLAQRTGREGLLQPFGLSAGSRGHWRSGFDLRHVPALPPRDTGSPGRSGCLHRGRCVVPGSALQPPGGGATALAPSDGASPFPMNSMRPWLRPGNSPRAISCDAPRTRPEATPTLTRCTSVHSTDTDWSNAAISAEIAGCCPQNALHIGFRERDVRSGRRRPGGHHTILSRPSVARPGACDSGSEAAVWEADRRS